MFITPIISSSAIIPAIVSTDVSPGRRTISKPTEQIEDIAREFSDRFGSLPPEARNLLYALRIKILAAKAGIESISTEHGQIILRLLDGLQFNRQKLEPSLKDGIKVGITQLRLNPKRLGDQWQRVMEDVLGKIM